MSGICVVILIPNKLLTKRQKHAYNLVSIKKIKTIEIYSNRLGRKQNK